MKIMPVASLFKPVMSYQILNSMKVHRIMRSLFVMVLMALASPTFAATTTEPVTTPTETPEQKLERLQKRLEEIEGMDRNKMTRTERKALKREVREIRDEVKALSGGVYLSIGALLVVVLLLILLL
jgi:hypothetical protein